jgi:hypothetical protein
MFVISLTFIPKLLMVKIGKSEVSEKGMQKDEAFSMLKNVLCNSTKFIIQNIIIESKIMSIYLTKRSVYCSYVSYTINKIL